MAVAVQNKMARRRGDDEEKRKMFETRRVRPLLNVIVNSRNDKSRSDPPSPPPGPPPSPVRTVSIGLEGTE